MSTSGIVGSADRPINAHFPTRPTAPVAAQWLVNAAASDKGKVRFAPPEDALCSVVSDAYGVLGTFVLSILLLALLLALQPSAMMTDSFICGYLPYSIMIVVARPTSLPVARIVLLPIARRTERT